MRSVCANAKLCWQSPAKFAALLNILVLTTLGFIPIAEAATPPVPSQPTPACDANVGGQCYVNGSFNITATSPGAHHYKICRSNNVTGWGGCNFVMTHNTGSIYNVSGSNLPGDGFRRAFYYSACDSANNCTSWGDNPEAYVTMDATGPTKPGNTAVSCNYAPAGECWVTGNFTASVTPSTDSGSGVDAYHICRSRDIPSGWAGCDVNLDLNGGTSISVSGSHLPAAGSRRAFYFRAKDNVGNWGPWNTPRYVRVDRNNPTVSANNASPDWFTSRTATIAAADSAGGAVANSGLSQVRYRWNAAHNGTCTTGTVTSSGATLTVPEGDNTLYLCAKDNTGRVGFWNGQYRVDDSSPTQPGPTTVACPYAPSGECWVTGDFTASVTPSTDPSGIDGYQICRSQDSPGGWAGCNVNLDLDGGTSIVVTGSHLASPGYRRAYYFRAKDNTGTWGPWNTPRYVRVDRNNPTVSATNASPEWFESRTATISAADTAGGANVNSGFEEVRYRWNTGLNGACTNGTVTTPGATLNAPAGDNVLYLCAKDKTGRVGTWNGQYRVDTGPPTQPGPTTVACAYAPTGECWVTGDFTASVTPATDPAGVDGYQICRSQDSPGGWAGCNVNLDLDGGTSILVSGSHLASPGFRRAYYFRAKDNTGAWGPWNTPRYVRVDRNNPTVSATNASPEWFESRTATLSAADTAGGAGANSGFAELRYRWNTPLNGACTNGTITQVGATLTVPEGDNTLYLCARDNTGRVGTWNGTYRVDSGPPTAPGPTTVNCALTAPGECWVTGNFVASVTPANDGGSGVDGYQICRSQDSEGGWAGCNVNLSLNGGTSITVSGSHLPSDGFRRAYYFRAKDNNGNWGPWNTPRYVRIDRYSPAVSATNASSDWFQSRTATLSANDSVGGASVNTGLAEVRYRWNAALNAGCTNGTVTSSGATLTAPEGDNTLYLCARDNAGRVGTWNGQYRVDNTAPSRDSITVSSNVWSINDGSTYDIVAKASDAGSGVRELRALINLQGSNTANQRGNFSWRDQSLGYQWSADQVPCDGGGFASKHPTNFNPSTITLVGCSTSLAGGQRTVTLTVKPNSTFGEFGPINDISLWTRDFELNALGWLNFDLNFSSFVNTTPPRLVVSSPPGGPLPQHGEVDWGDVEPGSGTNNEITKPIRVENGAATGGSNLLLEGSPSNVQVVNTQGNAFSWSGTLDSPLAPGQQDEFEVHMDTSQAGTFKAQLRIWHNDFVRPVPLRIELEGTVVAPEPVVDRVDRSPVRHGQQKIIIVHGHNFHGASVHIGTEAPEDGDPPPNRVYPTAELVTINSAGTRLEARINATAPGVDGFYNLGIETSGGSAGAQFRVVPPEPVVDMFTPSQTVQGSVHVLTLNGVNLQGANVVPMNPAVKVLDLDNSDDASLMGLLYVESGGPVGPTEIMIEGLGGDTQLPITIVPDISKTTVPTKTMDIPGRSDNPDVPNVLLQEPAFPITERPELGGRQRIGDSRNRSAGQQTGASDEAIPHKDGSLGETEQGELDAGEDKFGFCIAFTARSRSSFSSILLSLTDELGNPITRAILDQLVPGDRLNFNSLTLSVSGYLEFEFVFRVCDSGITDLYVCLRGGITFMVPFVGGQSFNFTLCAGIPGTWINLSANGFILNHNWSSNSGCATVTDNNPSSQSGSRSGQIAVDCCADSEISLQTEGVVFDQPFNVEGPVTTISPYCPASDNNNFAVVIRAFIPVNYATSPNPLDICRQFIPPSTFIDKNRIFAGDDRGFEAIPDTKPLHPLYPEKYRMKQEITMIPDESRSSQGYLSGTHFAGAGETLTYTEASAADGQIDQTDWDWPNLDDCIRFHAYAVGEVTRNFNVQRLASNKVKGTFSAAGPNPLSAFSPDIDWNFEITLEKPNPGIVAWTVHAQHDCMPAYEVFINNQLVYSFMPGGVTGNTISSFEFLRCLPWPMNVDRVESGVFEF